MLLVARCFSQGNSQRYFMQNITSCHSFTYLILHMLINAFPSCFVKVLDDDWYILVSLYGHILL